MDRYIVTTIILSFLLTSCYDSFDSLAHSKPDYVLANTTIEHIHTLYNNGTRDINQELIAKGIVVANDEHGNFFKSFIIESDGYAIEVLDGLFDSYVRHPIGSKVVVRFNNLALDRYQGVLRCGLKAPATSPYALDYMTSETIVDLHLATTGFGDDHKPEATRISDLNEDKSGTLIRIDKVQLHTDDSVEREWSGYSLFRNADLDSIWCYTSPFADFATMKIPQDEVSLIGTLQFGNTDTHTNQFILKLRDSNDCIH